MIGGAEGLGSSGAPAISKFLHQGWNPPTIISRPHLSSPFLLKALNGVILAQEGLPTLSLATPLALPKVALTVPGLWGQTRGAKTAKSTLRKMGCRSPSNHLKTVLLQHPRRFLIFLNKREVTPFPPVHPHKNKGKMSWRRDGSGTLMWAGGQVSILGRTKGFSRTPPWCG